MHPERLALTLLQFSMSDLGSAECLSPLHWELDLELRRSKPMWH